MQERRNYNRYIVNGSANLKNESDNSLIIKGDLLDLSFIGFSVRSQQELELNRIVFFEIMPELLDNSITGKGKIIDATEIIEKESSIYKVGVEFIEVDKNIVLKLINANQSKIIEEGEKAKRPKFPYTGPL